MTLGECLWANLARTFSCCKFRSRFHLDGPESCLAKLAGQLSSAMSFGESTAVFKARAKEIGISDESFAKLEKEGLTTMATFAFCCHFNPSAADEKPLTELVARVLEAEPSLKEMSCFRRLFAEAYATVASDIKAQVEATEDSSIKKLAPADRAERLREQQARLSGLDLKGNLEPGDSLIDRAVAIYESDRLQYIEWQHCVSRQHELLTGLKKDASLTLDGTGGLKISSKPNVVPCDVSSDMLVRYALVRRGLALEQANILDYKLHDELLKKYMFFRLTDPPPGYARVSLKQIEQADRQFILLMAEQTRNGIRVKAGGTRPCDNSFRRVFERPLAAGAANREAPTGDEPPLKRLRPPGRGQGRGRNGKGSSKGSQNARVPAELLAWGCVAATPKGHALCYDFSLGKCARAVSNQRCERGLHLCAVKGCHRGHAAKDCPNKKTSS